MKTIIQPRYNPEYKIKSQAQIQKANLSTALPSNLQYFKEKLSGSGFIVYK